MKELVLITTNSELTEAVEEIVSDEPVGVTRVDDWPEAKQRLVERHYDVVCIDYDDVKIEGLDSFIQLDNILEKEDAAGLLILRDSSRRARDFGDNLTSFSEAVTFREEDRSALSDALWEVLGDPHTAGEFQRPLPELESGGDLTATSLVRLLHTIRRTRATGFLAMRTDGIDRRWGFRDGELLDLEDQGCSAADALAPAFAWDDGQWSFEADAPPEAPTLEFWDTALRGVYNHVSQRAAMNDLMPRIQQYAAASEQGVQLAETLDDAPLSTVVEACDGQATLEQALSALGANATRGFQAAYFALECDAIVLDDGPLEAPLHIVYPGRQTDGGPRPASDGFDSVSERSVSDTEEDLRETLEDIEDAEPYEIFDLWEGCGQQAVRDRFYKMVKTHHPDAYGGNISDEAKDLAERVFINIKRAHTTLLKREGEQTVPPPGERSEAAETAELNLESSGPETTGEARGHSTDARAGTVGSAAGDRLGDRPEGSEADVAASASGTSKLTDTSEGKGSKERSGTDALNFGSAGSRLDPETTVSREDKLSRESTPTPPPWLDDPAEETLEDEAPEDAEAEDPNETSDRNRLVEDLRRRSEATMSKSSSVVMDLEEQSSQEGGGDEDSEADQPTGPPENPLEPADDEDQAKEYFNDGYKAFKNNNEVTAFHHFERAHEFDPENGLFKAFYAYALFLVQPEERETSRDLLDEAIRDGNRQVLPDAHLFLGRILKVKDRHKRAKKHFERALDLNPASIEAKRELRLYQLRGESSSVVVDDEDGKAKNPNKKGPSFKDDPAGYIKNLLNKDLF